MSRPESVELAATENTLAAASVIREAVAILAQRGRGKLNKADLHELETILAAAERITSYQQELRAEISAPYQKK